MSFYREAGAAPALSLIHIYGALGGGKALVAGQEGEALGLVAQKHGAQVAVAKAHGALCGHRAGDGEGLQALADGGCTAVSYTHLEHDFLALRLGVAVERFCGFVRGLG